MLKEFKEFAIRGNVMDMAVGVIIGGAFGKIISSLVSDIIMPPIGLALGGVDFSKLSIVLKGATPDSSAVVIKYGVFTNTVIDFIIIAFAIFIMLKQVKRFTLEKSESMPATKECQFCCSTISLKATKCPNCTSGF